MKIGKRLLTSLLALVLTLTCILPGIVPQAKAVEAITYKTYFEKVQSFLADERFNNDTYWDEHQREYSEYSSWKSWGCCAYAATFAGYVYGFRNAWSPGNFMEFTNPAEIRTGDIIYYRHDMRVLDEATQTYVWKNVPHWIVVLERTDNKLWVAEGNADNKVRVSTDERWIENGQLMGSDNITEFKGYHYNFAESINAHNYKKSCLRYTTVGSITVTKDNANINDRPCSQTTQEDTVTIAKAPLNQTYQVCAVYKNSKGNFWYEIDSINGQLGCIYAGNCTYTPSYWDVQYHNAVVPSAVAMNGTLNFGGKVSSGGNKIHNVSVTLYRENGEAYASKTISSIYNEVDMSGFSFDLSFSKPTTLSYMISAEVGHYDIKKEDYTSGASTFLKKGTITLTCAEHKWGSWTTTKAASCTAEGSRTHSCTVCGESASEAIPVTGHNWAVSSTSGLTCTTPANTNYVCLNCGETKSEKGEVSWSDWTTDYPETSKDRIETKTQYRYRELDSNWQAVETGYVDYVASWPHTFDHNNSYRITYGQTPKTAYENADQRLRIVSDDVVGYLYHHWCRNRNNSTPGNGRIEQLYSDEFWCFHAYYSTNYVEFDSVHNAWRADNSDCCRDTYWYFQLPVRRQTYAIENKVFEGEHWGNWGEWSDTPVTASDSREVETREVYRYINGGLADHSWDLGIRTKEPTAEAEGEITYTCYTCGNQKIEYLPKLDFRVCDHDQTSLQGVIAATCTASGYSGDEICDDCGGLIQEGKVIPATGHSYENGICGNCGEKDPDASQEPEGDLTFSNFAELAELARGTYDVWTPAFYVGNDDLVIEKNLTIPGNLGVVVANGAKLIVPRGVTLTVSDEESMDASLDILDMEIQGTLRNGRWMYIYGIAEVSGTLENACGIDIYYREGGRVRFAKNAAYIGEGELYLHTEEREIPEDCFEGLELNWDHTWYEEEGGYSAVLTLAEEPEDPTEPEQPTDPEQPEDGGYIRIAGSGRCETAREVAEALQEELGGRKFSSILYTSALNFADALAGSYLSAVENAPILLYWKNGTNVQDNLKYIQENLAADGTVYILGGFTAVPESVDEDLAALGIDSQRVAGSNRYLTNLAILRQSGFSGGKVLVCTATNFADSLSASATGLPILLVYKEWTELSKDYKEYLSDYAGNLEFVIVGGNSAVHPEMEKSLKQYGSVKRLAGKTRYETSVLVAEEFFDSPREAVLAYAMNFPDGLCGGALAYAKKAPLILTNTGAIQAAETYAAEHNITAGAVLGSDNLIDDASANSIFNIR